MNKIRYRDKEYKVYQIEYFKHKENIFLIENKYQENDTLAVIVMSVEEDRIETFSVLTVNLSNDMMQTEKSAFIDANNNDIWDWRGFLESNRIAENMNISQQSGYCMYPLYKFDTSKFYANE